MGLIEAHTELFYRDLAAGSLSESVEIQPPGEQPRSIRAMVRDEQGEQDVVFGVNLEELLMVRVAKDPAAEIDGVALGGIAQPETGTRLLLEGDSRSYSYRGIVRATTRWGWLLEFRRPTLVQHTTHQVQGLDQ